METINTLLAILIVILFFAGIASLLERDCEDTDDERTQFDQYPLPADSDEEEADRAAHRAQLGIKDN